MKNKDYIDSKEENFVERNTTPVASPPEELPFEVELPENSPRRKNIPEETPVKGTSGQKVPLDRNSHKKEKSIRNHTSLVMPHPINTFYLPLTVLRNSTP